MPGRNRRVSGEQTLPLCLGQRLLKPDSGFNPFAHQLQRKKCGVPFVHMEHRRLDAQAAQQPHASHAQQDFLHDARRVVAPVNALREISKMGFIRRQVGIDQIHRAATDVDHPDAKLHRLRSDFDLADNRLPIIIKHRLQREVCRIKLAVILRLPIVGVDRLLKISLAIKQANPHKPQPKITSRLGVVARQHSQATSRNRQGFVKTELCTKIRHRAFSQTGSVRGSPRVGRI